MDYSKITIDLTKHPKDGETGGSILEVADSSFIDLPTLESYLSCVLPYLTRAIVSSLNETNDFTIGIHIQFPNIYGNESVSEPEK